MSTITKTFKLPPMEGTYYYHLESYKKKLINGHLSEKTDVSFTGDYSNLNWLTTSLIEVTDRGTANRLGVTELGYYVKAVCQENNTGSERNASNRFTQSESGNIIYVDFTQVSLVAQNLVLNVQTLLASTVDRCFVWLTYENGTVDDITKDLTYEIRDKYPYSPWSTANAGPVNGPFVQYKNEYWVSSLPGIKIPSNTYVICTDYHYPNPQIIYSFEINFFDRDNITIVNLSDRYPQISRRVNWDLVIEPKSQGEQIGI